MSHDYSQNHYGDCLAPDECTEDPDQPTKHTPEPWIMTYDDDPDDWPRYWPSVHAGSSEIIGTEGFYGELRDQSIADARRVVACVNACVGISTETLEQWAKSDGFNGLIMHLPEKV